MSMKFWKVVTMLGFVIGYLGTPLSALKAKIIHGAYTALGFLLVYGIFRGIKGLVSKSDGKLDAR